MTNSHDCRYDRLAASLPAEQIERSGLLRVSPDFLVIAIGVPVPKYEGNPLDPPLRSRFACRSVTPSDVETTVRALVCATQVTTTTTTQQRRLICWSNK